ncbi:MAG: hypothetical protein E6J88_16910, partial [Deltaproteobacteria bacterium]
MPLALVLLLAGPIEVLQMLNRTVEVHGAVISSDGARVAWVEQAATPDGPNWEESFIQVQEPRGSTAVHVTAGKTADEGDLAFSPDGSQLAFLSDAEKKHQPQLYVADLRSGQVRQLTHVDGHLQKPLFSPDGKSIAVLFIEGGADLRGPVLPSARLVGVVEEQIKEQRIAVVPIDGSAPLKALSPPDLFVYEYSWRPDGGAFAATAAHGSGDDNWWIAKLYAIEANGAARVVHQPALQICEPAWSPDGKRIAFIEGLMSDHGSNGGDLFVAPADGNAKARNLTPGLRGSVASVRWRDPEKVLVRLVIEGDAAFANVPASGHQPQLYVADLRSGQVRQLTHVDGHLQKPLFSPDGKSIAVLFIEGGADLRGPVLPSARLVGVVEEQIKEQRIAVVPIDGSAPLKALSPPDLFVYEYSWRPDGGAFAATAAHGSGDDNWWIAKLYAIEANGAARVVHQPALQICEPAWSPDGKR